MLELINDVEQLKKIILGDLRFEMNLYYCYYWLSRKNDICCLEIYEDHNMKLLIDPYIYQGTPLWCTQLCSVDDNDEREILINWKFIENLPLKLTTNLGDILEVCPIS